MKREDKVKLLLEQDDFCEGFGIQDLSEKYQIDYMDGFKDAEINIFYYDYVDQIQ